MWLFLLIICPKYNLSKSKLAWNPSQRSVLPTLFFHKKKKKKKFSKKSIVKLEIKH